MSAAKDIKTIIKQIVKASVQSLLLPVVYSFYRSRRIDRKKVVFADSNSDTLPESMSEMYKKVKENGYEVTLCLCDIRKAGVLGTLRFMCGFMREYAQARCVFICNYFLPVCSCKKKRGTYVVQLWHSCGLLKKFAYDTKEDISPYYKGSVTDNIDLITVSSQAVVPVFQNGFRLKEGRRSIVKATGVSRTDVFFKDSYNRDCRERFYRKYPQWKGKKIVLWAPTFRGTAADPKLCGAEAVKRLARSLGDDWAVVIKLHPHLDQDMSNCDMSSSELFACADLLISDYSSLIFEYALYRKPFVIFAPDLERFEKTRGSYIDLRELPCPVITDGKQLDGAVREQYELYRSPSPQLTAEYEAFVKRHCGACDGSSTDRIFKKVLGNK